MKATGPRLEILRILLSEHGPFSADELHSKTKKTGVDLTTVYRSLEAFEWAGIVISVNFRDGISRYEIRAEKHHHHHLICLCCRKSETIEKCTAGKMDKMVEKKGFARVFHTLELFGLCPDCQQVGHAH
jgi:Fe2+ or Zn2+ uptake regulation protein